MPSNLVRIYTAQYRYSGADRIDITVKGNNPKWGVFKPSWEMVMGVKNGTMPEKEYVNKYLVIIDTVPTEVWAALLDLEEATFVCFCSKNNFCHRNILTNFILNKLGDRITYGGWKS